MEPVYIVRNNELYHHGTKGMKWGRRLYQHKDGSLTTLGRLRYGKKGPPDSGKKEKPVDKETQKRQVLNSRSATELYKNAHLFDDQELKSAYSRLVMEQDIAKLSLQSISKGERILTKANMYAGKLGELTEKSSKLYNGVARILNAYGNYNDKDYRELPLIDLSTNNNMKNIRDRDKRVEAKRLAEEKARQEAADKKAKEAADKKAQKDQEKADKKAQKDREKAAQKARNDEHKAFIKASKERQKEADERLKKAKEEYEKSKRESAERREAERKAREAEEAKEAADKKAKEAADNKPKELTGDTFKPPVSKVYEGDVIGEGTSKSNIKSRSRFDYGDVIDVDNYVEKYSIVPVSDIKRSDSYSLGVDRLAGYLTTSLDDILDD